MGLLSIFRKKNRENDDAPPFRGAPAAGGGAIRSRTRSAPRTGNAAADPILPEKKRARRRLIGAGALLLVLIIVLPRVFDSHPVPPAGEIAIDIPASQSAASASDSAAAQSAASSAIQPVPVSGNESATASAGPDTDKAAITAQNATPPGVAPAVGTRPITPVPVYSQNTTAQLGTGESEQRTPTAPSFRLSQQRAENGTAEPTVTPPVKTEAKAAPRAATPAEAVTSREEKSRPAEQQKAEARPVAPPKNDSVRALAILEGRVPDLEEPAQAATAKSDTKSDARPNADRRKVAVQVAAVSSETSANELIGKLKASGISAYTQKSGNVIRVRVGPFNSRAEAEQMKSRLAGMGMSAALAE